MPGRAAPDAEGGDDAAGPLPARLGCAQAWLEHLAAGAALVALWLYMDIRHGRKGFRAGAHRALMAAVTFCALAWTLRAGILTGQSTG